MKKIEIVDSLFRKIPGYEGIYSTDRDGNPTYLYWEGDDCYEDWREIGKDLEHPELMELFDWLEANAIDIEWGWSVAWYHFEDFYVTIDFGGYS